MKNRLTLLSLFMVLILLKPLVVAAEDNSSASRLNTVRSQVTSTSASTNSSSTRSSSRTSATTITTTTQSQSSSNSASTASQGAAVLGSTGGATNGPVDLGSTGGVTNPQRGRDRGVAPAWDPKRSVVFMVGVLKWKSGELESFSSKFRRDAQLLQELIKSGVPKEQTSFLADSTATLPAILANLRSSLDNCPAGDTYIFYYCGHGWLDDNGKGFFANYDAGDSNESCLSMDAIVKEFDKRFKGAQAIFLADCCRSGQLEKALKKSKFKYAVLTAATSAQDSTSNWTFTQAVLDAVSGHSYADANRDGAISFDELGKYCKDEMRIIEKQEAAVAFGNGFDRNMKIADVKFKAEAIPERVEVLFEGDWWQAKLLERKGKMAKIHWLDIGWDAPEDESWVKLSRVRPMKKAASK